MDFSNMADDFFLNLNLETTMRLPGTRETVLHFFESLQKEFPSMASFHRRGEGEHCLEADREAGAYRWAEVHSRRLCAGHFNPPNVEEAMRLHNWLLEHSVYYLGIGGLDIEALDVMFGFNLDYTGNRDQIVADALLCGSPLGTMLTDDVRPVEFEPSVTFALDEGCYLQARLSVETRCNSYQVRTAQYDDEPISVYFTVRRYPTPENTIDAAESFRRQCQIGQDYVGRLVIPDIVRPIAEAIATAQ
ncbi:MAG: hypothetical protein GVY16_05170 [Planctomycetes bacterium]|jgi:hypothetical protein|nr:hypothetical protein [Planctomycetota bacterium]